MSRTRSLPPAPPAEGRVRDALLVRAVALTTCCLPVLTVAHLATGGAPPAPARLAAVGAVLLLAALVTTPCSGPATLAAVAGGAQVVAQAVLVVGQQADSTTTGCLPAVGTGARLGLRLAVLRLDPTCPEGTAAVGPTTTAAVSAMAVAVAVVCAHAAVAVLAGLAMDVSAVWVRVVAAAGHLVPLRRLGAPTVVAPVRFRIAASRPLPRPLRRRMLAVPVRRGPPLAMTA